MRYALVAVGLLLVWTLGCSGMAESFTETVQDKVQDQAQKVDAAIVSQVRTALTDACQKRAQEMGGEAAALDAAKTRVNQVCTCVADELLAVQSPQDILGKLDRPEELAKPYVEKCGALLLNGGAPPSPAPEGTAEP